MEKPNFDKDDVEVLHPDQVRALEIIDSYPPGTSRRILYSDAALNCTDSRQIENIRHYIDTELERRGYPASAEATSTISDANSKFNRMMDMLSAHGKVRHQQRMQKLDALLDEISKKDDQTE